MPRKTPRPPEEARAIARNLRRRYISAEAEATAKAAMSRLEAGRAGGKPSAKQAQPLDPLRQREQIQAKPAEETGAPFTEEEKARAKAILARLHMAYPRQS